MAVIRPVKGSLFEIHDRTFAIVRRLKGDLLQLEARDDGEIRNFEHKEIMSLIAAGKARAISPNGQVFPEINSDFSLLSEQEQAEAERRLAYVLQVEKESQLMTGIPLLRHSIETCAKLKNDPEVPSVATVYRWAQSYRDAGNDPAALVPTIKTRGNRCKKLPDDVHETIQSVIDERYLTQRRLRVSDIYPTVVHRIERMNETREPHDLLPVPARSTLHRIVNSLDPYEYDLGRYGKFEADLNASSVGPGATSSRPLERVEIDHTTLDIIVCDDVYRTPIGRPTFTVIIDHFSRMPLGYHVGFEGPGTEAIMQALRCAILPKDWVQDRYPWIENDWPCHGVPEAIVTDNGMEFHSRDFELACAQLTIDIQHTPAKKPWTKGVVERFIGEINRDVLGKLPGKTFQSNEARKDYKPADTASLTVSELEAQICKWIIDVHARKVHRTLQSSPHQRWVEGLEGLQLRMFGDTLDLTPLIHFKHQSRNVGRKGLVFEHIWYNNSRLQELRTSRRGTVQVTIKVNTGDLGSVIVADDVTGQCFKVPAVDQEYAAGLRYFQHVVIGREARRRSGTLVSLADLARAKEDLYAAGETARKSRQLSKRAGRFNGSGVAAALGAERTSEGREFEYALPGYEAEAKWGDDTAAQWESDPLDDDVTDESDE